MNHFEAEPSPDSDPRLDVVTEYDYGVNVALRFNVYRYAEDGRDVHQEIADNLRYHPGDVVLDAGCADGRELTRVAKASNVPLRLLGLDIAGSALRMIHPEMFYPHSLNRLQAHLAKIPLHDESVNTILSLFTLYHISEPEDALDEFRRVIKPDGTLVVATSGSRNKQKHREFEEQIADYLDIKPSPRFAETFTPEHALSLLSNQFDVVEVHQHKSYILIKSIPAYTDYLLSLQSMKDTFSPMPPGRDWRTAVFSRIVPQIAREIAGTGAFRDPIDRTFFICRPK